MAKLTRPVLIRLTEDEYQKLKNDAQGFKSLSYYLRELIKARQPLNFYLKHMKKTELSRTVGIERKSMDVRRNSVRKKIGRNAPCPCGSGKKYKKCCMNKENK